MCEIQNSRWIQHHQNISVRLSFVWNMLFPSIKSAETLNKAKTTAQSARLCKRSAHFCQQAISMGFNPQQSNAMTQGPRAKMLRQMAKLLKLLPTAWMRAGPLDTYKVPVRRWLDEGGWEIAPLVHYMAAEAYVHPGGSSWESGFGRNFLWCQNTRMAMLFLESPWLTPKSSCQWGWDSQQWWRQTKIWRR